MRALTHTERIVLGAVALSKGICGLSGDKRIHYVRAAQRLAARGLLVNHGGSRFSVTDAGRSALDQVRGEGER